MGQTERIQTFGEVSPRFMLELVTSDTATANLNLLLWDGERAHIAPSVLFEGAPDSPKTSRLLYPPDIDSSVRKMVRFPTHSAPYESERKLFDDLCALINEFMDLSAELTHLVAVSVLGSWLVDCAAIPTCLWIVGPRFGQGRELLRLLNCLYRRPLLLGEVSLAGLCSLPLELRPSLLIEQREVSPELQKVLRGVDAGDGRILCKGQFINMCCAMAICTEEPLNESICGRAIEIPLPRASRPLSLLDQRAQDKIANEFQPKLLMYRLANAERVRNSTFDDSQFGSRVREVARFWGACVDYDTNLRNEIVGLLKEWDTQVRTEFETDLMDPIVIEAMLSFCHQDGKGAVHVGEITAAANGILERRGEVVLVRPRMVGHRLRALGVRTTRLDAAGRGVLLLGAVRQHIHKLARDRALVRVYPAERVCKHCMDILRAESSETQDMVLSDLPESS